MLTTATGRPPDSSTARRITAGGTARPTVAMRTAEDWVGCWSHFPLPNRTRDRLGTRSSTAFPVGVLIAASAGLGGRTRSRADPGRLHVDGVHMGGVQHVGLL